jgi:hypothetical protein
MAKLCCAYKPRMSRLSDGMRTSIPSGRSLSIS